MSAVNVETASPRVARVPDILDVIAQLSSDEVPTPPLLARALLDLLPPEVWSNPDYRWLNPASQSGAILRETAKRSMIGLADWESDPAKRADHILRRMLHGCSITQLTGEMTRRSVYISRDATSGHAAGVRSSDPKAVTFPSLKPTTITRSAKTVRQEGLCKICSAPSVSSVDQTGENHAYAFIQRGHTQLRRCKSMKFKRHRRKPAIPDRHPERTGQSGRQPPDLYQYFVQNAIALDPKYLAMIVPLPVVPNRREGATQQHSGPR